MDNILRINVAAEGIPSVVVEPVGRYAMLGGRAMTSTVLWEEVPPDCDPLGGANKVVISPGFMSGSAATTSGRISVGFKSPLTGGIKEANSGGEAARFLARLGYAAIIIEGAPRTEDLYKVVISKDGVGINRCNEYRMLGNYRLAELVEAEHGSRVALMSVGPAGEQLLGNSTIAVTDPEFRPTRHAARGGGGAVLASKGIKAIVIDPEGASIRKPVDPEGFKIANAGLVNALKASHSTGQAFPAFGTAGVVAITNAVGCFPALNCSVGQFEGAEKISGEALAALENERGGEGAATHGCHGGCAIRCSGTFYDEKGNYVTKQPEYETLWSHGGNCGISDLDAIARLDRLDDDLGLDTIEMGCTIAVMMEAGELSFGDAEGALRIVAEVGEGTERGRLIGSGTAAVARHFGVEHAPVVKGQAMAGYDPRALKGIGVTYATSPMGADHTAGHTLPNHLMEGVQPHTDALAKDGQWLVSSLAQIGSAAIDATGYCLFVGSASHDRPEALKCMMDSMRSFTGLNYNEQSFAALGMRILRMELDFNRRAGFTKDDDRLPAWMTREPLPPHNSVFDVPEEDLDRVHDHVGVMMTLLGGMTVLPSPPISLIGAGVHTMLANTLAQLGVKKPLVVTDPGVVKAGLAKIITDHLASKEMGYAVFDGTEPNPTVHNVNAALRRYKEEGCDGLVALGGGSAIDCCKAAGVLVTNPGSIHDYVGLGALFNRLPPLVAIATTSGTGSEATIAAVITDSDRHTKTSIADSKLVPIVAFNDPLLTKSMPPHITAGTGMDALTHAIEAYLSPFANASSDGLARQAIELIVANLPKAVANGEDLEARTNMCHAQYNAGLALNSAGLGNTHSMAHALGARYQLPHGDCNSLLLPQVLSKNRAFKTPKWLKLAQSMGIATSGLDPETAAVKVVEKIEWLKREVAVPATILELANRHQKSIDAKDIPWLCNHAILDFCCTTNPVRFGKEDFREIYERVWS